MITNMAQDDNVYWAVIRNKGKRTSYIEIAEGESGRWNVVLDTDEFTLRVPIGSDPDFFDLLAMALAKRES
jgi:hypothetical protein